MRFSSFRSTRVAETSGFGLQYKRTPEPKQAVRIIAWITAVCLLGDSMLYIVLPVYWEHFGLKSLWEVGFLLSINRFVRLPLNPGIGWLYGRISKRTGFMLAVSLALLTTLAYGSLSGFTALLLARALWGAAWSLLRIGGYLTVLEASTDENRGALLGSYNGILGMGSLFGMLAGGVLAELIGVHYVAWILGAVIAAGLPLAWRYVPGASDMVSPANPEVRGASPAVLQANLPPKEAMRANPGPLPQDGSHVVNSTAPSQSINSSPSNESQRNLQRLPASLQLTLEGGLVLFSGLVIGIIFFGVYLGTMSPIIEAHLPKPGLPLLGATLGAASVAGLVQAVRWAWSPILSPWIGAWSDGPRGRLPVYIGSLALAAAALGLLPAMLPFAAWLAVLLAAQLANTAIVTLTDALAADSASSSSRVAYMTTYTTVVDIGAALGPLLGFATLGILGLGKLYGLCSLMLALLGAAWLVIAKRKQRRST